MIPNRLHRCSRRLQRHLTRRPFVNSRSCESTSPFLLSRRRPLAALSPTLSTQSYGHGSIWERLSLQPFSSMTESDGDEEQLEDELLFRQTPLMELHLYLVEKHNVTGSPKNFIQPESSMLPGKHVVWTAKFKCPISGRLFKCGRLRVDAIPPDDKVMRSGVEKAMELDLKDVDDDDDKNIDDVDDMKYDDDATKTERTVYYPRKVVAIQAAAARALDIYRYEESQIREPRICVEDPAELENTSLKSPEEAKVDDTLVAEKRKAPRQRGDIESKIPDKQTTSAAKEQPLFRNSPSWELDNFYRSHLKNALDEPLSALMECETVTRGGNRVWTAQFTCPVSGRTFQTGTLRPDYVQVMKTHPGNSFEIQDKGKSSTKRIFYQKKQSAVQAAAASALDLLRFERDGTLEPRICDEDPLEYGMTVESDSDSDDDVDDIADESQDVKDTDEMFDEPLSISTPKPKSESLEARISTESGKEQTPHGLDSDGAHLTTPSGEKGDTFGVEIWDDDDGDSSEPEEFVLQESPQFDNQSPALRIVSSLTKSSSTGSIIDREASGSTIVESEDARYFRLWNEAYSWVESQSRPKASAGLHGIDLPARESSSNTLVIAKSLLASLGESNYSSYSPNNSSQGPAFAILNYLWDTNHAKPDTEVYNLYMRCLEATDSVTRAIRAECIVERMKNRGSLQGHLPPKPDAESFNTLLGIWAQVGGENGRYSKLEPSFEPTKESFLAVLSSSSYGDDDCVFDLEFAQECIDKMIKLQEEDESRYALDTQVMNAPIRWSGGLLWRKSRPNTRRIKWDNLVATYSNGFREYSESDALVQNALNIEQWVRGMVEYGVSPDIESFEAMIQAWVRTGTREGLEKAEGIIKEAEASPDLHFRIQTVHPILAAWLHVQHDDSPAKILKWVDFVKGSDDKHSSGQKVPDRRLLCLELASRILKLDLDVQSKVGAEEASLEEIQAIPLQCSELLERMVLEIQQSSDEDHSRHLHMVIEPFLLTLTAWSRSVPSKCSDPAIYEAALQAMTKVIDDFAIVIQDAAEREKPESVGALSEDLRQLVSDSYAIYSCFVGGIRDISTKLRGEEEKKSDEKKTDVLVSFLCDLERVVRRMEETHQIGKTVSTAEHWSRFVYADRYEYDFHHMMGLHPRPDKGIDCWTIATLLEGMSVEDRHNADMTSLCYLLKKIGPVSSRRSNFDEKVNKLLDRVLNGGQHRKSIFSKLKDRGGRHHHHPHAQKDRMRGKREKGPHSPKKGSTGKHGRKDRTVKHGRKLVKRSS